MKKIILTLSFVVIGFGTLWSQSTIKLTNGLEKQNLNQKQSVNTKLNKGDLNYKSKSSYSLSPEGTNDPLSNGYTKQVVDGKVIYVKHQGTITTTYIPNNKKPNNTTHEPK